MSQDRYANNSTNYVHPQESNLLNVHKAMEYNDAGEPVLRTSIGTSTINISGPVTIPGSVEISNDEGNPVPISGTVEISSATVYQGTDPWNITGSVAVTELPPITGTVEVSNFPLVQEITGTVIVTQGTDPWVITGSVSVSSLPEVEISNDIGNPIPVSANTTSNSNINPIYVKGTSDSSFFHPAQLDAFGRLRVSNPFTLFDSFHRFNDNGKINQATNGAASTSTHSIAEGCVTISIGTASGAYVYRESNKVFAYQPGKSLLIFETFAFGPAKPNLRTRYGYFDSQNGLYLERDGSDIYFVRRSTSITGTMSETREIQANWNLNPLPELNLESAQILFTEIEWLGVGSVRQGFVINGEFVPCHRWDWANQPGASSTYMATACLPIRSEIENIGITTSTSMLKEVCSTVISEGGYELRGKTRSIGHSLSSPYTLSAQNTVYPIFSMRLKNTRLGGLVVPKTFTIGIDKAANFRYTVVVGGVTTGGSWVPAGNSDSTVEYNLTAGSITGGVTHEVGFINASNQASISPSLAAFPFQYQLERNTFSNTSTEFTICIETDVNTGPKTWCSVNWEEIT